MSWDDYIRNENTYGELYIPPKYNKRRLMQIFNKPIMSVWRNCVKLHIIGYKTITSPCITIDYNLN